MKKPLLLAFNGVKTKKFTLPYMLEEVGSKAFDEAQMDMLCLRGNAFTANCSADAFTPSLYANCMLFYEKDKTIYVLNPQTHESMLYQMKDHTLTELTIPDHEDNGEETYAITSVSGNINEMPKLQTLTLPATLKSMGAGAFFSCPALTTVISHIEEPFELDENIFSKDFYFENYPPTLYVPVGTKAKYEALDVWNRFGEIIEIDVTGMESLDTQAQDIHSTQADEGWYTLQGVRLNSKPSTQGLFLHGERKVFILQ